MNELPILSLDNFFLFPKCSSRLLINPSLKGFILQTWKKYQGNLLIVPAFNKEVIFNGFKKVSSIGTLAKINTGIPFGINFELVFDSLEEIELKGIERVKIVTSKKQEGVLVSNKYQFLLERELDEETINKLTERFIRRLPYILEKAVLSSSKDLPQMTAIKGNISNIIDFITQNGREISWITKWKILNSIDLGERLDFLINFSLTKEGKKNVEGKDNQFNKQREKEYLKKELENIKKRLGNEQHRDSEIEELEKYLQKVEEEPYPEYVKKVIKEEIKRYKKSRENPVNIGETSIIRQTYIDWLVNLPWYQKTSEISDLEFARRKLDEKHYGLSEIKQRIRDYLAVRKRVGESFGKVICLVGPPGTGKTSLARSIAEATGRKFVETTVEGIRDVAEILGHRRTYIGAMPGRIIQIMREAQVINPLFLIDEIDKFSNKFYDNPAYSLLKVLNPEQNQKFVDNYLGIPYDLSKVMFICTANIVFDIPPALLDRMEIIQLYSYTEEEKLHIAKKYLIPKNLAACKVEKGEINFQPKVIREIIRNYTYEKGVRDLNRKIELIFQRLITKLEQNKDRKKHKLQVSSRTLKRCLKKKVYEITRVRKNPKPGLSIGLAWTEKGGDILLLEAGAFPGKGNLELTGNLGEIMQESAKVSFKYVKTNGEKFGINQSLFSRNDISIHAPEGAIPKDGPSAGIALASAIISTLTNQTISQEVGMTGEITLHGNVLRVGGIREKMTAARQSGLKYVIIPKANKEDIGDVPSEVLAHFRDEKGDRIIMVENYEEVWKNLNSLREK